MKYTVLVFFFSSRERPTSCFLHLHCPACSSSRCLRRTIRSLPCRWRQLPLYRCLSSLPSCCSLLISSSLHHLRGQSRYHGHFQRSSDSSPSLAYKHLPFFFYCGLYFQPGIGHVTIIRSPGERQCFFGLHDIYQRSSTTRVLMKKSKPVFFLFFTTAVFVRYAHAKTISFWCASFRKIRPIVKDVEIRKDQRNESRKEKR